MRCTTSLGMSVRRSYSKIPQMPHIERLPNALSTPRGVKRVRDTDLCRLGSFLPNGIVRLRDALLLCRVRFAGQGHPLNAQATAPIELNREVEITSPTGRPRRARGSHLRVWQLSERRL